MLGKSKILLIFTWSIIFILLYNFTNLNFLMYWWVLLSWFFFITRLKIKSTISFILSFLLFILSILFTTFSLNFFAEILMRVSFLILIIGYIQVLIKYKQDEV